MLRDAFKTKPKPYEKTYSSKVGTGVLLFIVEIPKSNFRYFTYLTGSHV